MEQIKPEFGGEEEIGIKPEHIAQAVEEAKDFAADKSLDLAKKVEGLKTREGGFETWLREFMRRADEIMAQLKVNQEERDAHENEADYDIDANLKGCDALLKESGRYIEAAKECATALHFLRTELIPLTDGNILSTSKWQLDLTYSITRDYVALAAAAQKFFKVGELETIKNNLAAVEEGIGGLAPEVVRELRPDLPKKVKDALDFYTQLWEARGGGVKYEKGKGLVIDESVKRPNKPAD